MTRSSVGVVVINWNGLADTLACLESMRAAAPRPARIVVVDNGSTDGSLSALRKWQAAHDQDNGLNVTIVESSTNRGFSGANNIGVTLLHTDAGISHFLLLNNDATVDREFFAEIARALDVVPNAAIMGPTIYVTGERGEVWYAGGDFIPLRALVTHRSTVLTHPEPVPTEFVTGCAMLISRSAWDTLGQLPECYFIYLEDAEYSWRAHATGLAVLYAPRAIVHHAVGGAIRRQWVSPRVAYVQTRNRALFVRRNLRGWWRLGALAYLVTTKPARALLEALRGRPALGWAFVRGAVAGLLSRAGRVTTPGRPA